LNDFRGFIDQSMYSNHEEFKTKFGGKVTKVLGVGAL